MSNGKRNVHNSGPLGMLVRSGQITKIEDEDKSERSQSVMEQFKPAGSYFKTQSGVVFDENEIIYIDPKICEPWKYANRLNDDMGEIDDLMESIRENNQLQPALVRPHPNPHGEIKYEVIFGRRRHEACLRLGKSFLVIKKVITDNTDAIATQEAENRMRRNVSNYSNAMLYKRLIEDGVFNNEGEMAKKLGISRSSLYDIMAYSKIPIEIVKKIPDIHNLSNNIALKIVSLLKQNPEIKSEILSIASEIGESITSPSKLERELKPNVLKSNFDSTVYKSAKGKKLFSFKSNQRGAPLIEFNKDIKSINFEKLCAHLKIYLDKEINEPVV